MVSKLFSDAAAEIENTVFYEGERARNGLRHGLRLQAVAKSWSKNLGLAEAMPVTGAEGKTQQPPGTTKPLFYNGFEVCHEILLCCFVLGLPRDF